MGRKASQIDLKRCKRLKLLLDDYGMSQVKLWELTGVSKTQINRIVREKQNLTDAIAEEIVKAFPEEQPHMLKEWLMGRKDYRSTKEQFFNAIDEVHQEGELLSEGLSAFAELSGFSIEPITQADGNNSFDNFFHALNDGFVIARNGHAVNLTPLQLNKLQNEICDYIEFTLDRIVTGKRSI